MRISDWSSDVCSSDLGNLSFSRISDRSEWVQLRPQKKRAAPGYPGRPDRNRTWREPSRSDEHTSELPSLMRISYAVFCLTTKPYIITYDPTHSLPIQHLTHHPPNTLYSHNILQSNTNSNNS